MAVRRSWKNSCRCDLCGYEWRSTKLDNTGKPPKECPNCKRMDWNEGGKKK